MPGALPSHSTHGDGSPLLLIAGWGQAGSFWARWLDHLPRGFRAVTIDNRETGATGQCPEGFTVDDMAADALAVMDHLGHPRFGVVGHSMGGMIAQALAFAAPERVEHLVLVSTGPGAGRAVSPEPEMVMPPQGIELPDDPDDAAVVTRAAFYERYIAPGCEPPRAQLAREEAERAHGSAPALDGMVRQLQAITSWEPRARLAELELPIAVVHGDADPLVPHPNGEIVAGLAAVPLQTLPGVGHMVPWEAPVDLAAVVSESRERSGAA